jgi:hypothetical protein
MLKEVAMFDSVILDVLVGIVFVFLLLSALTSWINEVIAQVFRFRAKDLKNSLKDWLQSEKGEETVDETAKKIVDAVNETTGKSKDAVDELYKTGIIKSLYKDKGRNPGPSYISAHDFVSGLFEYILEDKSIPKNEKEYAELIKEKFPEKSPIKKALLAFYKQTVVEEDEKGEAEKGKKSEGEKALEAFTKTRKEIEQWYDSVMERLSGYYKRKMYWIGLGVAFLVSALMNVDSIAIVESLWDNQHLRDTVVATTIDYSQANLEVVQTDEGKKEPLEEAQKALDKAGDAVEDLQELDLPILWVADDDAGEDPYNQNIYHVFRDWGLVGEKFLGVIISAFAASQGSQIWFDMLKMAINVRGSGPNPAEKDKKKEE